MPWFRVDDQLCLSHKALTAGNRALGLWVRAGSWAMQQLTDGHIPTAAVTALGGTKADARALVAAGLWHEAPGGYAFPAGDLCQFAYDRQSIPKPLRAAVYERDGHRCVRCGSIEDLTLDHIHPWSRGGTDTEDNLQTMCRSCNSSKGARIA